MRLATPPDLNGLVALAEKNGVDIRPTLLRVLTDLYVQKTTHTREEEQRFAELALWLLASADLPTRVAVANKLGGHPATPHAVLRRLARDVSEVAAPVLRHTPRFTEAELRELVQDCGESHAAILAERQPAVRKDDADVIGAERTPAPPRAQGAHGGARVSAEGIGRLEGAALRRKPDEFASVLQELLEIPEQAARRVIEDETGESLIAAAKALEMPTDVVVRILILLNPTIGRSVQRVFELVASFRDLAPETARQIVDGWRVPPLPDRRHAHYQPVTWADVDPRPRRSEARRDAARREQSSVPSRVQRTT